MARVSISEAARLAGVSKPSLYKMYINKGTISISTDSAGKEYIDTSDLLRVFGELKDDGHFQAYDTQNLTYAQIQEQAKESQELLAEQLEQARKAELALLREQLAKSEQRERQLLFQIDKLTTILKSFGDEPEQAKPTRSWWKVLGK